MAARRRRPLPRGYKDGGRVPDPGSAPIPDDPTPIADVTAAPGHAAPPASDPGHDAVARAVEAQRHAEELQRDAMRRQQPAPEQHEAPQPQVSDRRRNFVREHPELAAPENNAAVMSYYGQARRI